MSLCLSVNGTTARFSLPRGVAVDSAGNIYVADSGNNTIRRITSAGVVSTVAGAAGSAGSTNGTGAGARFYDPSGLVFDAAGNLIIAETANHSIRRMTPAGVVTTLAGLGLASGPVDGAGTAARFDGPVGATVDGAGNLFVADSGNNAIRRISTANVVTTFAGTASSGADILIAGFNLAGTSTKQVLIRAIGPGLAAFNVAGALADSSLQVLNSAGAVVASNDNWTATLGPTFARVGAFPLTTGSRDAALLVTLAAGASYTVQVAGADGGTGEALVEVYEVF